MRQDYSFLSRTGLENQMILYLQNNILKILKVLFILFKAFLYHADNIRIMNNQSLWKRRWEDKLIGRWASVTLCIQFKSKLIAYGRMVLRLNQELKF